MPIFFAVLITRQAISPRLAIRIFLNMRARPSRLNPFYGLRVAVKRAPSSKAIRRWQLAALIASGET